MPGAADTATSSAPVFPDGRTNIADTLAMKNCRRVASDRRDDVQSQGFATAVQQDVYDKSYAECLKWSAR